MNDQTAHPGTLRCFTRPRVRDLEGQPSANAEQDWRIEVLHEGRLYDLELAHLHLADHLPPHLLARTSLAVMRPVAASRRATLAECVQLLQRGPGVRGPEWQQHYEIRLGMPCTPAIVMHEAAHVHLFAAKGEHLHDAEFRLLMVWLAERTYGKRAARRLERMYQVNLEEWAR